MTGSFLTDYVTGRKSLWILCKFTRTLRGTSDARFLTITSPRKKLRFRSIPNLRNTIHWPPHPRQTRVPPQSPSTTEATPSLPAQSVNAPVFVPKSSTPTLSAAMPSLQSAGSPVTASNLTSPSRSNVYAGWSNPTEYDEGEDPFDPFSNYQHGNGYENDRVAQRLQTVSSFI